MFRSYRFRNYDIKLILMITALSVFGAIAVGSAAPANQQKQILGIIAGTFMMIFISFLDYTLILKLNWLMYFANVGLLGLVIFMGADAKGAQRWLDIGGFRFQPSETAKILLILFFAQFIMKRKEKLNTFRIISFCILLIGIPWFLIFEQPDLSTSIIVLAVFCVIMFTGGLSYKVILGILAVAIPTVIIAFTFLLKPGNELLEGYQLNRIYAFLYPEQYATEEAYQQLNSVTAIASGMLNGKGYNNNEITSVINGNFVSEPQTDFIFTVIGEEFGFKGCIAIIILITAISVECINIALKAKDLAGKIIAAGMGGLVAIQSFVNIGVTTFLLPNTGLPLPFVSYGLTSLLSLYIGMGFVLNVRLQSKR